MRPLSDREKGWVRDGLRQQAGDLYEAVLKFKDNVKYKETFAEPGPDRDRYIKDTQDEIQNYEEYIKEIKGLMELFA